MTNTQGHVDTSGAERNEVDDILPTSFLHNQGTNLSEDAQEKPTVTPVADKAHARFTLPAFSGARTRVRFRRFSSNGSLCIILTFSTSVGRTIHRVLLHISWNRGNVSPG
ncbi:unnamed protein product [Clavelina lepadiformis]|uniref:Uncharacterized protein n=1 Tax=Clavelina lepadiformis TaxID=159417 RepID=A0ABP0GV81_CLALP